MIRYKSKHLEQKLQTNAIKQSELKLTGAKEEEISEQGKERSTRHETTAKTRKAQK